MQSIKAHLEIVAPQTSTFPILFLPQAFVMQHSPGFLCFLYRDYILFNLWF